MRGWLDTDVEPIKPDDAPEAVKTLRRHLRNAQGHRRNGDAQGTRRASALADKKLVAVAKMLEGRFGRHAKGAFGDKLPHFVEEAVGEMFLRLCSELRNLEAGGELYETEYFNLGVKRRVMIGAIRHVRVRHDMPSQGEINIWDYVPESVQKSEKDAAAEDGETYPIQPADPEAVAAFERVIGKRLAEELLALLDQRHRDVLILRTMKGLAWAEVAGRIRVSKRTATRYHAKAVATLKKILEERG